jgi:predicted Zn-dependent protease
MVISRRKFLVTFSVGVAGMRFLRSAAVAQSVIDDRGEGTVNHNYFAAAHNAQLKHLLNLVEKYHFKPCPHGPGGVYEDISKGRYDYVKGDLTYVLERFVNHPTALQLMTPVAKALKQFSWPIGRYENALKWYPNYAVTHAQYGSYLVETGSETAGIEKLEEAVKMDGKLIAGYVWLSKAYTKTGNMDSARQAADKARELGYKGQL